jgi:putative hydrolase of the HAD superfamily
VDFIRQQHPFLECFTHEFFSYELRHTKRERVTFLTVLYTLGRQASECVFIDDLAANIEVARSAGLRGIQFQDARQLTAELRALGLDVE